MDKSIHGPTACCISKIGFEPFIALPRTKKNWATYFQSSAKRDQKQGSFPTSCGEKAFRFREVFCTAALGVMFFKKVWVSQFCNQGGWKVSKVKLWLIDCPYWTCCLPQQFCEKLEWVGSWFCLKRSCGRDGHKNAPWFQKMFRKNWRTGDFVRSFVRSFVSQNWGTGHFRSQGIPTVWKA